MAECELTSKTYEELRVVPGAAKVMGDIELFGSTHGFFLDTFSAAEFAAGESATLITKAENVKVTKIAGTIWVAGDPIFWLSATENFTNLDNGSGVRVGTAYQAAGSSAVVGYVNFSDHFDLSRGLHIGTSAVPYIIGAADPIIELFVTSPLTSGNVESMFVKTVLTGAGATGGRAKFRLETNVVLGGWANGLKAEIDFLTNGAVSGVASAFVAEMTMPGSAPGGGNYAPLELELNIPASAGLGAQTAFQFMSVQGDQKALMDTSGFLFILNGLSVASGKLFQANTAADATHALRISIDGVAYYIMLTNSGA